MKAVVISKYGGSEKLELRNVKKPIPKENEVLVKIKATTVSAGDCELRRMDFPLFLQIPLRMYMGIFRPRSKILGQECSGVIEVIGSKIVKFEVGDEVMLTSGFKMSTYAEYINIKEDSQTSIITLKPRNISFEEAATLPIGGLNALKAIEQAKLKPDQHILINGAGGSIGTIAIQLAKLNGAIVSAVDHLSKHDMLRKLNADVVIDYEKQDFTKLDQNFDVIFDIIGTADFNGLLSKINEGGCLVLGNPKLGQMLRARRTERKTGISIITNTSDYSVEDLNELRELVEQGHIKPVVDTIMEIDQIQEAHDYVENWQKKGSLAIRF